MNIHRWKLVAEPLSWLIFIVAYVSLDELVPSEGLNWPALLSAAVVSALLDCWVIQGPAWRDVRWWRKTWEPSFYSAYVRGQIIPEPPAGIHVVEIRLMDQVDSTVYSAPVSHGRFEMLVPQASRYCLRVCEQPQTNVEHADRTSTNSWTVSEQFLSAKQATRAPLRIQIRRGSLALDLRRVDAPAPLDPGGRVLIRRLLAPERSTQSATRETLSLPIPQDGQLEVHLPVGTYDLSLELPASPHLYLEDVEVLSGQTTRRAVSVSFSS